MEVVNNKVAFLEGKNEVFHEDDLFNIQIKRCVHWGDIPLEQAFQLGSEVECMADLMDVSIKKGKEHANLGKFKEAASFLRCGFFFLTKEDPRRSELIQKSIQYFQKGYQNDIAKLRFIREELRLDIKGMGTVTIPVYRSERLDQNKSTIVFHGGYDSTLEELLPIALSMGCEGKQVILFEGPGQGSVLESQIPMSPEWENVVTPILDKYGLQDVCLVGLSMGGYLAPRAAAFERRITSVVVWGPMMNFQEVVFSTQPPVVRMIMKTLLKLRLAPIMNGLISVLSRVNPLIKWGIGHGKEVFGVRSAYDFFLRANDYDLKPVIENIHQPVLILVGTEDHLVPMSQLYQVMEGLKRTKAVTVRIFSRYESAADHCQIGNPTAAIRNILDWLDQL